MTELAISPKAKVPEPKHAVAKNGSNQASVSNAEPLMLSASCACGGGCARCNSKRKQSNKILQTKLLIGAANDIYEQEADRVADHVLAASMPSSINAAPLSIQRVTEQSNAQIGDTISASVDHIISSDGSPLEQTLQQDMGQRFGHDFADVRIHADANAAKSAQDLQAKAYTVGQEIVFGAGQFSPSTHAGRHLLAHELTHVVQQRTDASSATSLQRQPSTTTTSRPPHITQIVVDQNTPQQVTATFSDGHSESDTCSTGKGHCCFDDDAGTVEGGACSAARSIQVGNNCTPIGDFTVTAQVPVTSGGVRLWTQFHNAKSVALHEYSPVDGTPLSHGCVRMNTAMAQTIYDGTRVGLTRVRVQGLARPSCSNTTLQNEWSGDFSSAGTTPPDGTTIDPFLGRRLTPIEVARERNHIRESREELRNAYGVNDAGLDTELATVQGGASIVSRIPRCLPALTTEEQQVPAAQTSGLLTAGSTTSATTFTTALSAVRSEASAVLLVQQTGEQLWQAATAAARAGGGGSDDRQLYWTRLMLTTALRQWNPSWLRINAVNSNVDALRRLQTRLIQVLEQSSRGITSTAFPASNPDEKRVLISGFDPFGFSTGGDIRQSNLSGAATLALDGETLTQGSITAHVEGVIFPVRYSDFNDGIVENNLRPHLTGSQPPHLVMSISQGGSQFELEETAGRRRSAGSFLDNLNRPSGTETNPTIPPGSPALVTSPEFLPHSVPSAMLGAMRGAEGRTGSIPEETTVKDLRPGATQPRSLPAGPGTNPGIAVEGSGGGFLSNEMFYRNSLLRTVLGSTVPMIHLHTPRLAPGATDTVRNNFIDRTRTILRAAIPNL